jgi:hypothetical protein
VVRVNGKPLLAASVRAINDHLIKAAVRGHSLQVAGAIPVTVTNADGNISNSVSFNALGPQLSSIAPGRLVAGIPTAKVVIRGADFRVHSKVLISSAGSTAAASQIPVTFISNSQVSILIRGASASVLSQPGTLNVQVVNPNSGTGNLSETLQLQVVPPNVSGLTIAPAGDGFSTITISGQFFRPKAQVQFLMGGQVVLQRSPDTINSKQMVLTLTNHKIDALGQFQVQVVNPGGIVSNSFSAL